MSNLVCRNCKSISVEYEDYCGGTSYYRCKTCGQLGDKNKFTQQSVFDRITQSPEVLAHYLVRLTCFHYPDGSADLLFASSVVEGRWVDRAEAIAATVEKLQEVEK
jgi:hypothetical protein